MRMRSKREMFPIAFREAAFGCIFQNAGLNAAMIEKEQTRPHTNAVNKSSLLTFSDDQSKGKLNTFISARRARFVIWDPSTNSWVLGARILL